MCASAQTGHGARNPEPPAPGVPVTPGGADRARDQRLCVALAAALKFLFRMV